jgi:tRNA dimethylallyltransferase
MSNKTLISIIGPTAIGKTSISIKLAQHFNTEIISADSRQFYKEMHIGTAAPTPLELAAAQHHFIHHKSVKDHYSVGAFEKDAINTLDKLFLSHDVVIMVGGSGLYIDAVTKGLDYFPEVDKTIREQLNLKLQTQGLIALQNQLKELDEVSYNTIERYNPHRVIRALEICIGTKKPYSSFKNKTKNKRPFKTVSIGLTADRALIYKRINERVDSMIENGLVKEVKQLLPYQDLNALNTVGYKEIFMYLNGNWPLDFAISEIKKNTRRYAKRQLTWFKKYKNCTWFDCNASTDLILETITQKIK